MEVPCGEGVATHTGPESCVAHREVGGEALTGVRVGRPLSRESAYSPGCRRRSGCGRQHGWVRQCECLADPAWSETPACAYAPCSGTGRSAVWPWPVAGGGPRREGPRRADADDAWAAEVGLLRSTGEAGEQSPRGAAEPVEGRRGAKGKRGRQSTWRTQCRVSRCSRRRPSTRGDPAAAQPPARPPARY